jgi:sigma-B regulation protein RsbU (phosphoserine phosphatase)
LGISFLNDIVSSDALFSPAEILNQLRDRVISELRQTGEDGSSKDGMDISLIRLNLKTFELQWAGANNALNYIQAGELKEIKADKQPIGYHPQQKPFTNHEIQLQKGDSIYIYSDGYADQFGGPKGKKLTYKKLDNFINENYQLSLENQKTLFREYFDNWKGSLEQLDDVCVIGIKI